MVRQFNSIETDLSNFSQISLRWYTASTTLYALRTSESLHTMHSVRVYYLILLGACIKGLYCTKLPDSGGVSVRLSRTTDKSVKFGQSEDSSHLIDLTQHFKII